MELSREELDQLSLESHRRAIAAIDEGRFENEIVEVRNPHVGTLFAVDETPRRDTSLEALAALSPAFLPEGVVTAGSSSQICDGAAGVLVASERKASGLGLEPRARFVSFGLAGSTRTGCCTATRRRASGRSRRRASAGTTCR